MSFKDLEIKTSYNSMNDNILDDFYVKVLEKSKSYCRIAGFFSSATLLVCSQGIKGLIENNGKMKLIVSPQLSNKDVDMIKLAKITPEKIIEDSMLAEFKDINKIDRLIEEDYVIAFGWLIANDYIDIKVAIPVSDGNMVEASEIKESGLFHMKVGILEDLEGNIISFSGSINETAAAWTNNIEEFKVFKGWVAGQDEYCMNDIEKFNILWNDYSPNIRMFEVPRAVKEEFVNLVPEDYDISQYRGFKNKKKQKKDENFGLDIELFEYQKEAIKKWNENDRSIILEMATGTGKTIAAIGCMSSLQSQFKNILYIIVCPQNTIFLQWKEDIEGLGMKHDDYVIADGTNRNWREDIESMLLKMNLGMASKGIIYTTFNTFSNIDFIEIVRPNKRKIHYMLVVDEVHGIGSKDRSKSLLDIYDSRLGLSATPERWFDDRGTKIINDYFNNNKFVYSMRDALNNINPLTGKTYLTPYEYRPLFVNLTYEEINNYNELSKKISRSYHYLKDTDEELLELLIFKRAEIHKDAYNKYEALKQILEEIEDPNGMIIFLSPEQMDKVLDIGSRKGIRLHKFTQEKGTIALKKYGDKTERELIIERFKDGHYNGLLAIKCLDEGIDIPSASTAILMSSSTNPREYIQRIGRVIRRFEGKECSYIYDIIVEPDYEKIDPKLKELEFKIYEQEIDRALYIARNAKNSTDVLFEVQDRMRRLRDEF